MDWQNPPAKVKLFVSAAVAVAIPIYIWAIYDLLRISTDYNWEQWSSLIGITVVAWLGSSWVVRIPRTITWMAVADCLMLSITVIYGIGPGIIANGPSHLVSYWVAIQKTPLKHRGETLRWRNIQPAFNLAFNGISPFVYGWAYYAFLPDEPLTAHKVLLPVILMAGTYFLINSASVHAVMSLAGQGNFKKLWSQNFPLVPLYFMASASGAAIIFFFQRVAGPWAFSLALPILMVVYYAHRFYNEKFEEVRGLYLQTVRAFANSIDALEIHTDYKSETRKHVSRTQIVTLKLAQSMGLDNQTYEALEIASMLHDVGKISIPNYILHKPGKLTQLEFQKMSTHPVVGAQILSSIDFQGPVIEIVRHHHENWDGSGYPDALKEEEIPLGSRILRVADCYEALRARRVYRTRSLDQDGAVEVMKREVNQFDPEVFKKFLEIVPLVDEVLERMEIPDHLVDLKEHRDTTRAPDIVDVPHPPALGNLITAPQREVFHLFEISQTMGNSLSRTDTLTILASKIAKIIPFDTLVIYLADDSGAVLNAAHTAGLNQDAFRGISIEIGTRLAGWVAANNRMLYNVDPGPDTMGLPEGIRERYQNAILAPLAHEERPIGSIALYAGQSFRYSDDHIRLMEIVANRASIALYNAIRFEETQEDAFTDRLTGLSNSRFLYIFFDQTLSEAKRYKEPLTVIEMDLDDFKSINDRYGHHSGDRFLKEVGRILKGQMRESDVLVRYAGDEFIAVLPKTTAEQARLFSYRLQDAVESAKIDVGIGKMLSVGISLGLASYPTDGMDLESLLMAADKNMYEHKSRRKGRRRREDYEPGTHQPSLFGTEENVEPRVG